jgi:tRNA (guanine9-N1)-methyltransferase
MESNCLKSEEKDFNESEVPLNSMSERISDNNNDLNSLSKMSKKQLKRLERNKKWLESKPERKKRDKEKRKLKLEQLRASGLEIISRKAIKSKLVSMNDSKCKVSLCIDCDFEDYMNENDIKKLVKQIGRCYAVNKHNERPVQLFITSVCNRIKDRFMKSQSGYGNWDANVLSQHWTQVFNDNTKIIYLTSDSENVIPNCDQICLSNDLVFIIGGLVDHNRYKGLCHGIALSHGVRHGRLPIDDHIEMTQRRVLAVNHGLCHYIILLFYFK